MPSPTYPARRAPRSLAAALLALLALAVAGFLPAAAHAAAPTFWSSGYDNYFTPDSDGNEELFYVSNFADQPVQVDVTIEDATTGAVLRRLTPAGGVFVGAYSWYSPEFEGTDDDG